MFFCKILYVFVHNFLCGLLDIFFLSFGMFIFGNTCFFILIFLIIFSDVFI
ncbi:uncharacterized protein DS421_2g41450 [Arachis hypogaea]|nr:uncharacterized protein DS421_2g41450 [Arachis hypogaea]